MATISSGLGFFLGILGILQRLKSLLHGGPLFRGQTIRVRHYRIQGDTRDARIGEEKQLQSAQSLSIDLGVEDLSLGIYAKHRNRLRFEVRYLRNVRRSMQNASTALLPNTSWTHLQLFVAAVAENATERMNIFLRSLEGTRAADQTSARTLARFLAALNDACKSDQSLMEDLLAELASNGRLATLPSTEMRRLALDRLVRGGVVERRSATVRGRNDVFDLTDGYRAVGATLRAAIALQP